jgi:GAF domain-containing protein/HAMP domain-containing protein
MTKIIQWLFDHTGGFFILLVVTVAQFSTYLVTIPISLLIRLNAEFTDEQFYQLWNVAILFMILSLAVLLALTFLINRKAIERLQDLKMGHIRRVDTKLDQEAWIQISFLPWRYARSSFLVTLLVGFSPMIAYEAFVLRLSTDQVIYTIIGVFISSLSIVTLGMISLEGMLTPARQVLLPANYDMQISGTASLNIFTKLNLVILTLITIGILLVAPIGYHFTVLAIQSPTQVNLLRNYQIQSLGFSLVTVILGLGLAWMLSRSVSLPLGDLVNVFRKVEEGDLNQKATVTTSDEIGALTVYFNRMLDRVRELQEGLESQVFERTAQLEAVNEVGQAVTAIVKPEELIHKVVHLITERFGHYYVALFLADANGRWAELKSATGETGRVLREARHRLEIGGKSMVGSSISQKKARIALDVGAEPVRFDNPLLPYTRSEIALPLFVGERVIGALDVQSTQQSAFGPQDIDTMQNMANQVAVALENARLFEETQLRLQELQKIQQRYIQQTWSARTENDVLEYGVGDDHPVSGDTSINLPLALRNQVIGTLSLTGETEWTQEERAWIESIATQAAIALENARLMEESQKAAQYQRLVAEITSKIWASTSQDNIMQTALKEIGRALNASEAVIDLRADTKEGGAAK